jgi:methanol--5-hydroxybenzimidazolylcobamide Co-methyltransferase
MSTAIRTYTGLAITDLDEFLFGRCPQPLSVGHGLEIGSGTVRPEINFTLPPMSITAATMPAVLDEYAAIIDELCARAVALGLPGLLVEFELLPELTATPEWGAEVTRTLRAALDRCHERHGLPSALRVTPNDLREFVRPPLMRMGEEWKQMVRSFELCADAGADLLAIESTGGKEVHDDALLAGDLPGVAFALGVLAPHDMAFLWDRIVSIASAHGAIASGDTACAFGNTAMVLAETRHIPRVWAAVIRVMTVARSLVAYEHGAVGPSKDCAYEGPYVKAITGCPISMEGAEAACAHLSAVGNIARATADLWSNESVANVKLLGGMAPTVSLEQLCYATRLMNAATERGHALMLRDLFVASDASLDPQAHVLAPDVVLELAAAIVQEPTPYRRVRRAALATLESLRGGHAAGGLALSKAERSWLDRLSAAADELPEDEQTLVESMSGALDSTKVRLDQYDLDGVG